MEIFTRLGTLEHTGHCFPVIVSRYGEEAFEISNSFIRVIISFNKEVLLNHGAISEKNENNNFVRKQLEVDFVCNLGYERIYIQSALNIDDIVKKEQEEKSLIKIYDNFRKIIVVKGNIRKWKDENGILIIGLKEFLTCPESIYS